MNVRTAHTSPAARAGILLALFATAIFLTLAVFLTLRRIGFVHDPQTQTEYNNLTELVIRLILLFFLAFSYTAILWNKPMFGWFREERWRFIILTVFAVGLVFAMADPVHAVQREGNWIRYWTAGPLALAGILAIVSATRSIFSIPDRVFGGTFGCLLMAAAADEMFQFHERFGELLAPAMPSQAQSANDVPTLLIALSGVVVLGALILLRHLGGSLGQLMRQRRYRLPLGLFAIAVITFLAAMMLDSFDIYLQNAVEFVRSQFADGPGDIQDRFWITLTDVQPLANTVEELLEFLSALCLLMMIGSLFSIQAFGFARPAGQQ